MCRFAKIYKIHDNKYAYTEDWPRFQHLRITCFCHYNTRSDAYNTEVSAALVELLLLFVEAAVISPA